VCCTVAVKDSFVVYLLDVIESASEDAEDPYHYPVIRVLVGKGRCCCVYQANPLAASSERAIPGSLDHPLQRRPARRHKSSHQSDFDSWDDLQNIWL